MAFFVISPKIFYFQAKNGISVRQSYLIFSKSHIAYCKKAYMVELFTNKKAQG